MKVLLDANVIISGLRFAGTSRRIIDLCNQGYIVGFTSDEAIDEVEEALLSSKFGVLPEEWETIEEALRDTVAVVTVVVFPVVKSLRDTRDLHILAAAQMCEANIIVSGDNDLLVLREYRSTPIMNPANFLVLYGSDENLKADP